MQTASRAYLGLAVVGLGALAATLDSAVNIAFPSITAAFALEVREIRWLVVAYVLTYASLMLVFGKLGDTIGYRRILQAGLAVGAVGYLACSLAPSWPLLLGARVLQGVGAALTLACGPAIATSLFEESRRTRVLAAYAAIMAFGGALGPLAGGWLVARYGWPAVFWARAPLVLGALAFSWLLPAPSSSARSGSFDRFGGVLLVTWLVALLLAATLPWQGDEGLVAAGLGLVGVLSLVAFVRHEARHPEPVLRPALFRDVDFAAANAASIAVNLTGFSVLLLAPFWLVRVAELGPVAAGLVLACNAVGIIVGSALAGRLVERFGPEWVGLAGMALAAVGLALVSTWTLATGTDRSMVTLFVQGLGVGLFQVAYTDRVTATLPARDRGVAGSLTMVTRTLGIVGGASGLSALHRVLELGALEAGLDAAAAFRAGFTGTFRAIAIGMAIAALLGLLRRATRARSE
jgi:MFS family permease